jgi:hypothetical protein
VRDDARTAVGDWAFRGCSGLTEVVIPSGVTSIGFEAFDECWGLKRLAISASLARIGGGGRDVFRGVRLDRVTLVCSPLDRAVAGEPERQGLTLTKQKGNSPIRARFHK